MHVAGCMDPVQPPSSHTTLAFFKPQPSLPYFHVWLILLVPCPSISFTSLWMIWFNSLWQNNTALCIFSTFSSSTQLMAPKLFSITWGDRISSKVHFISFKYICKTGIAATYGSSWVFEECPHSSLCTSTSDSLSFWLRTLFFLSVMLWVLWDHALHINFRTSLSNYLKITLGYLTELQLDLDIHEETWLLFKPQVFNLRTQLFFLY